MKFHKFYYLILIMFISSCSLQRLRYEKAYTIVCNDTFGEKVSIQEYGIDISGVYVNDSIYAFPLKKKYGNILSEKTNKRTAPLRKSKVLAKISKDNINKNWTNFSKSRRRPFSQALFSEIQNNSLRIDRITFFNKQPEYTGTVFKYYFRFKGSRIIEIKKWKAHYSPGTADTNDRIKKP